MRLNVAMFLIMLVPFSCCRQAPEAHINSNVIYPSDGVFPDSLAKDSLGLRYVAYACDCPSWVYIPAYYAYYANYNAHGDTMFNDIKYAFFVEPAGNNVEPLKADTANGLEVMFYGKLDTGLRYPNNAQFIDDDPPKGKVFMYTDFKYLSLQNIPGSKKP